MKIAITGATSGIGWETAKALLINGHELIFFIRDKEKALSLIKDLPQKKQIQLIACDLADLKTVKKAAKTLVKSCPEGIDVLINNAGGTFNERKVTKDGFEMHLSVNHLGHFLLVNSMIDYLKKHDTKIINLSSEAHKAATIDFSDLNLEKSYSTIKAYGNVKLFNLLFTKSLVDRGFTSYAVHPGVISSSFGDNLSPGFKVLWFLGQPLMKSAREGASTSIYLAINKISPDKNGEYFKNQKVASCTKQAKSETMREKLWERSEEMLMPFSA
ncbi:MAG: retinol dehydrogenase-12 [Marivirga sp.]|jgi:retinol dehydrogenase-12